MRIRVDIKINKEPTCKGDQQVEDDCNNIGNLDDVDVHPVNIEEEDDHDVLGARRLHLPHRARSVICEFWSSGDRSARDRRIMGSLSVAQ